MLFFQSMLLGGYLYAHWSIRSLRPKGQLIIHSVLLVLSLTFLPAMPALAWKPDGTEDPILRILGLLAFSVLPSSCSRPRARSSRHGTRENTAPSFPYRLFGLSNFASLLGLLAYPILVEPNVTLRQQSLGWSFAYAAFVALGITSAIVSLHGTAADRCLDPVKRDEGGNACSPPLVREQILWVLLAAAASTLLLAVTNHLTQNVASIPFLWVLPLGLSAHLHPVLRL